MRIAVIHSFYSSRTVSGENIVVQGQIAALKNKGHAVELFARYTDREEQRRTYGLRSTLRVITGYGFNFKRELKHFDPDLILVHNLFPNISTRWLERVKVNRIVFLHNFRPWCSNGFMLRNGKSCQKCLRNPLWGSFYRCANGSFARSLVQSFGQVFNYNLKRLEKSGAKIVAVSKYSQNKISEFSNLRDVGVLSNFISFKGNSDLSGSDDQGFPNKKFVWAGRISTEKGLADLLDIWPTAYSLDIFGTGPDLAGLKEIHGGKTNISFKGSINNDKLMAELPKYTGFVNSSTWSEFAPMSIIEALSIGLPIVFPNGISLGELLTNFNAGEAFVLRDSESLRKSLERLSDLKEHEKYVESALRLFTIEFSFEGWYEKLLSINASMK